MGATESQAARTLGSILFSRKRKNKEYRRSSQAGLTLLEILIVIAILAIIAVGAIRLGGRNDQGKKVVRQFHALGRQLQSQAKLSQSTYRLVIDMKEGRRDDEPDEYWIEKSEKPALIQSADEESDEKSKPLFAMDNRLLKEPQPLPEGFIFDRVEVMHREAPVNEGKAYVYFFPSGLVQEAAIHLHYDEKLRWTISFHPLSGRAFIAPEDISLKEIQKQ